VTEKKIDGVAGEYPKEGVRRGVDAVEEGRGTPAASTGDRKREEVGKGGISS